MGNIIGITVIVLFIGGIVWFLATRKKNTVEGGKGTGGGVTPKDPNTEITE